MMKLLIADDGGIRRLPRLILECTHELIEAADGAAALRVLFPERPDALPPDVAMAIIDGLAVFLAVRAETEFGRFGIVIISASVGSDEAPSAGADLHPPKPSRPPELSSAIDAVASRRRIVPGNRRATTAMRLLVDG